MPNIPQTAKQAAINVARQTARESNEFLKSAREQIAPTREENKGGVNSENSNSEPKKDKEQDIAKIREHSGFMQTYKHELEQIRKDNLFKKLQKDVTSGVEVPLAEYLNDLSSEQREVLKAQMEAVKVRKMQEEEAKKKESVPEVISKKGRQMFNMFKKRNEQHFETRQPPSS